MIKIAETKFKIKMGILPALKIIFPKNSMFLSSNNDMIKERQFTYKILFFWATWNNFPSQMPFLPNAHFENESV